MPQKIEKKKEKRKLGILEMATKEFEDESEVRHSVDFGIINLLFYIKMVLQTWV